MGWIMNDGWWPWWWEGFIFYFLSGRERAWHAQFKSGFQPSLPPLFSFFDPVHASLSIVVLLVSRLRRPPLPFLPFIQQDSLASLSIRAWKKAEPFSTAYLSTVCRIRSPYLDANAFPVEPWIRANATLSSQDISTYLSVTLLSISSTLYLSKVRIFFFSFVWNDIYHHDEQRKPFAHYLSIYILSYFCNNVKKWQPPNLPAKFCNSWRPSSIRIYPLFSSSTLTVYKTVRNRLTFSALSSSISKKRN